MRVWLRSHAAELGRFGVVGFAGVVLNLAIFNWLRLGPLSEDSTFLGQQDRVVTAKVIATVVSVIFAWAAHRWWTFRGQRTHHPARELIIFGMVNLVAIVAEAGVLALSHYALKFTSLEADNLASVLGIGVGTVLRYVGYKVFVFADNPASALVSDDADAG